MRDIIWKVQGWVETAWQWSRDLVRKVVPHADDPPELRSLKLYVFLFAGIVGLMIVIGAVTFGIVVRGQVETLVPNVQGKDILDALMELQSKELYPDIQATYTSTDDKGTVLSQRPAAGTLVKAGKLVTLRVSRGPVIDRVENYVGMSLDEVRAHLQTLFATHDPNIVIKTPILYKSVPNTPAGKVLAQSPLPGTKITGVASLELVVSQDQGVESSVTVGDYVGKSFSDAMADLTQNNIPFLITVQKAAKKSDQGDILDQSPDSGSRIGYGQIVQLTMAGPGDVGTGNVFGLFRFTLDQQPVAVDIRLDVISNSQPKEIFAMKHPGGPIAIPYIVPDGSELVLSVMDKEVEREKATTLVY
jgi:beta-lactam-binding protein with PASTA domain